MQKGRGWEREKERREEGDRNTENRPAGCRPGH